MTTSHPHHPIAVVGAGPGGLALARVLHVYGIEAARFDLDPAPTARTQGGMLDIHDDSGQEALRAAGLHEEFLATGPRPGGRAPCGSPGRGHGAEVLPTGPDRRPELSGAAACR